MIICRLNVQSFVGVFLLRAMEISVCLPQKINDFGFSFFFFFLSGGFNWYSQHLVGPTLISHGHGLEVWQRKGGKQNSFKFLGP